MNAKRLTELLGCCYHETELRPSSLYKRNMVKKCKKCHRNYHVSNRTFDNANDIAFAIGKLKEMGLLGRFVSWTYVGDGPHLKTWLSLSFTEQAALIEEFLATREQVKRTKP